MLTALNAFFGLAWAILVVNQKNTKKLFKTLNQHLAPFGFSLSAQHKKRIAFYTAQSAITNHWFSLLRGEKPSAQEITNAIFLGAFTPIADDLMDGQNITFEELLERNNTESADAVLFTFLYKKLAPLLQENLLFKSYFEKAHLAQNHSLKQLQKAPISTEELKQISFNKGGFYTTLYRMVLQNKPLPGEEEAIYTLGAILQLLNDLFDIHKDFHNGVQTLATNTRDIHFMRAELTGLEQKFISQYIALAYPEKAKRASLASVMAIVTRGHVALDYYQNLQGNAAHLNVATYLRKTLIVDMEKPGNIWKNLLATAKMLPR